MQKLLRLLLIDLLFLAVLLGFPVPSWSADGDAVTDITLNVIGGGRAYYLCHEKDSNDTTCAEFDLQGKGPRNGIATMSLQILDEQGCNSTHDVDVNHSAVPSADCPAGAALCEIDLADLSSTNYEDIFDWVAQRPTRYLNTDLSNMTACTDDQFDVIIILWPPALQQQ